MDGGGTARRGSQLRDTRPPARKHRRYRIIAELARGRSGAAVPDRVECHVQTVYLWRDHFNESGFAAFEVPTNPRGAVPVVSGEQVRGLIRVALSRPEDLGLPFTHWSVAKLLSH